MKVVHYPKGISPSFRKRAGYAPFWEAWVGSVLARANFYTIHHPFPADGGDQHGLSWDLDVAVDDDGPWTKVEVKALNIEFNSPSDYPFKTALICSRNSWERKWGNVTNLPRDFLLVSQSTGSIIWVPIGVPASPVSGTDRERNEPFVSMSTETKNLKQVWDFIEHVKAQSKR